MNAKARLAIRLYNAGRRRTGADVLAAMDSNPLKADLIEAAHLMHLEVPDGATKAEIAATIGAV